MLKAANNKKQILLVDDDRSVTETLTMLFETRGYNVTTACSGEEALAKATSSTDLVLLDIVLPDQEGGLSSLSETQGKRRNPQRFHYYSYRKSTYPRYY